MYYQLRYILDQAHNQTTPNGGKILTKIAGDQTANKSLLYGISWCNRVRERSERKIFAGFEKLVRNQSWIRWWQAKRVQFLKEMRKSKEKRGDFRWYPHSLWTFVPPPPSSKFQGFFWTPYEKFQGEILSVPPSPPHIPPWSGGDIKLCGVNARQMCILAKLEEHYAGLHANLVRLRVRVGISQVIRVCKFEYFANSENAQNSGFNEFLFLSLFSNDEFKMECSRPFLRGHKMRGTLPYETYRGEVWRVKESSLAVFLNLGRARFFQLQLNDTDSNLTKVNKWVRDPAVWSWHHVSLHQNSWVVWLSVTETESDWIWVWLSVTECDWVWLSVTECDWMWVWLSVTECDWVFLTFENVTGYIWLTLAKLNSSEDGSSGGRFSGVRIKGTEGITPRLAWSWVFPLWLSMTTVDIEIKGHFFLSLVFLSRNWLFPRKKFDQIA